MCLAFPLVVTSGCLSLWLSKPFLINRLREEGSTLLLLTSASREGEIKNNCLCGRKLPGGIICWKLELCQSLSAQVGRGFLFRYFTFKWEPKAKEGKDLCPSCQPVLGSLDVSPVNQHAWLLVQVVIQRKMHIQFKHPIRLGWKLLCRAVTEQSEKLSPSQKTNNTKCPQKCPATHQLALFFFLTADCTALLHT